MRPRDGTRLFLYDSASRGSVPFEPADPERVRIYTCGPTVYRYAHIGNLRTYLLTDLLVRTLRFIGFGTFAVQNITDMGHMHQEQLEEGEDKRIAAARAAGKSARERETRRRAREYPAADALREKIRAAGYDVVDAAEGTAVLRKRRETRRR